MKSLMKGEIQTFIEENRGSRNGYYDRDIGTRHGKIDGIRFPRSRNNEFQSALFEPYQCNIGIDDLVISMHSKGISTRKKAEILEQIFHNRYRMKCSIRGIREFTSMLRGMPLTGINGLMLFNFS